MIVEDIEILLSNDLRAYESNGISDGCLRAIDDILLKYKHKISNEVFLVYKKFVPMKQDAPLQTKEELFTALRKYMKERASQYEYIDALFIARFLIVKSELPPVLYNEIAEILAKFDNVELALELIKSYEVKETNKPLRYLTIGNFYNLCLKDYKTAIKYYEKYLKIDETKSVIYTIVGSLYAKAYGDFSVKDQIYYYEKAYRLKPDERVILLGLIGAYEKYGDKQKTDKFYKELLKNNPTDVDYYNYGAFLISCGNFKTGHKYLTHRFNVDNVNLCYPLTSSANKRWNFKSDISEKTLLVHYEQGYGDTFMYCRFLPMLKDIAGHVIFVAQDALCDLIKASYIISDGIEVISDKCDISQIDYDYDMALLDVPYVLGINIDNIPYKQGYLCVSDKQIEQYKNLNIKVSKKIKVGIAYKGSSRANYNERDIDFSRFQKLLDIDGIDFYSFVMNDEYDDRIICLGKTFKNFTDTACALKNMDVVISTDNVILNLAGALGVKTYGLFNKYPNFRWYNLDGENVGWYSSVKPYQVREKDYWAPVFTDLYNILK